VSAKRRWHKFHPQDKKISMMPEAHEEKKPGRLAGGWPL
jgi:hypothetical protein